MIRVEVVYRGRVQGVGFRATARELAGEFPGVSGWVRNQRDGSVTLNAQGSRADVTGLLDAIRARMARYLTGEHTTELPAVPGEVGFDIRR
ncbi:MAG: acylphosphatase [Phycisphaerales bacterium]|nr:acylphosphatase [Phycisphaerales bacterium]